MFHVDENEAVILTMLYSICYNAINKGPRSHVLTHNFQYSFLEI